MSLSSQFQQSQQDAQAATRAKAVARIDGTMSKMADKFAKAARGIVARKVQGKEPTWLQKRRTEKWLHNNEMISGQSVTPKFLEAMPGYRKLRDACADPAMDIQLRIWVSEGNAASIKIELNPTKAFSTSILQHSSGTIEDSPAETSLAAKPAAPAPAAIAPAPAPAAETGPITVLSPLKLKPR